MATVGLWALVAIGALAGCAAFATRPTSAGPVKVKPPTPTVGPEGFAELYVSTFLESGEGDENRLRAFYPGSVQLRDVIPGSLYVARTATVDATEVARRYWSVTVAAEVLIPEGAGYRRAGTRFYQVGIAGDDGSAYVATSLPAEVPSPATLRVPALQVGSLERVRLGDPVAEAVERFAAAFLAGDGELVRYVAPDAPLRAVTPPPFVTVKVTDLASHDDPDAPAVKEVLAAVRATDSAGRVQILHYSLELAERSGRWEVARLLPGPPLEGRPQAANSPAANPIGVPATTAARGSTSTSTPPSTASAPSTTTARSPTTAERTARP
ncbi:MAG: conjugal transfer protein [Acidimicrobiia bacterium]